ncbi:MAG: superoxide dismutase [Pseudonocardia sediminis]
MVNRRAVALRLAVLAPVAGLLVGCGGSEPADAPAGQSQEKEVSASFTDGGVQAVTYDPAKVPAGSGATVKTGSADGRTTTTLTVRGLLPNTTYGAHAHVNPCGSTGDAAGAHYQFNQDPVKPSVDPAFANPQNEIWLDLTTDAQGNGTATSTNEWVFPADRRAQSVIIHEMATMTAPGKAGTAGKRPACMTVPF